MKKIPGVLGVVMDPIEGITAKKDSTLAMLLAAQRRGWRIVYFRQEDLYINQGVAAGDGCFLTVADNLERWYEFGERWSGAISEQV